MKFQSLRIERQVCFGREDKISGTLAVSTSSASIYLKLTEQQASEMLGLVADSLIDQARELGDSLRDEFLCELRGKKEAA